MCFFGRKGGLEKYSAIGVRFLRAQIAEAGVVFEENNASLGNRNDNFYYRLTLRDSGAPGAYNWSSEPSEAHPQALRAEPRISWPSLSAIYR